MEVYIIRHGETEWNAKGLLQGSTDIELAEGGRKLAGQLGERLDEIEFDCIYSSPLIRAYETACLIRGHKSTQIIRDDRLKEISFGEEEGTHFKNWTEGETRYKAFFNDPASYEPPVGGESLQQVCARARDFLMEVIEPQVGTANRIMIVAHGAVNKGLMCRIEGNTVENYWGQGLQGNCEANVFEFDGETWTKKGIIEGKKAIYSE